MAKKVEEAEADIESFDGDPEVVHFSKQSPEQMLAALDQMIGASTDADDMNLHSEVSSGLSEDKLTVLHGEVAHWRLKVQEKIKEKQELSARLREETQNLQSRCDSQLREKAHLTERLQAAKDEFREKLDQMRRKNEDLRVRLDEEIHAKEQLHWQITDGLRKLNEKRAMLHRRIQDDLESQVSLVSKLDAESDAQSRFQAELGEEREKTHQQSKEVLDAFALGQPLPAQAPGGAIEDAANGTTRQQSGGSAPSVGEASGATVKHFKSDAQNIELRRRIKAELEGRIQTQEFSQEEQKELTLLFWRKKNSAVELKKRVEHRESDHSHIVKRKELHKQRIASPEFQQACLNSTPPAAQLSLDSWTSGSPMPSPDVKEILRAIDDLEKLKWEVYALQNHTKDTEKKFHAAKEHHMERHNAEREELKQKEAFLRQCREDLQQREEELAAEQVKERQKRNELEALQKLMSLQKDLKQKEEVLEGIQAQNAELEDRLGASRCMSWKSTRPPGQAPAAKGQSGKPIASAGGRPQPPRASPVSDEAGNPNVEARKPKPPSGSAADASAGGDYSKARRAEGPTDAPTGPSSSSDRPRARQEGQGAGEAPPSSTKLVPKAEPADASRWPQRS